MHALARPKHPSSRCRQGVRFDAWLVHGLLNSRGSLWLVPLRSLLLGEYLLIQRVGSKHVGAAALQSTELRATERFHADRGGGRPDPSAPSRVAVRLPPPADWTCSCVSRFTIANLFCLALAH
jgi:hypothetical protein